MLCLQIADGPREGERIEAAPKVPVIIGRADEATHVFDHDEEMSESHFSVQIEDDSLLLNNLSATRSTIVNGQQVQTAVLKPGDQVTAGQTTFLVVDSEEVQSPTELRVGGWRIGSIPQGWQVVEGMGLILTPGTPFRATMSAVEEPLPEGQTLDSYMQVQMDRVRAQVMQAEIMEAESVQVSGAEQAMDIELFSPAPGGERVVQHQRYAISRGNVGVFTVTLLESQLDQLGEGIGTAVKGLSFYQETVENSSADSAIL